MRLHPHYEVVSNNLLDDNVNYTIVRILAYWYSNQECFVRWRNSISVGFRLSNGTRQGGCAVSIPVLQIYYGPYL